MGYTHYWYREPKVNEVKMNAIIKDFEKVLPSFKDLLGDWEGKPITGLDLTGNIISFNGIGAEAHESFHFPLIDDGRIKEDGKVFNFCKTA